VPIGHTVHQPSGDVMPIWQVAKRYEQEEMPTVLIAGERYGMGSSRDWAAKSLRLLGIRAVLALSFERIHRTNLIGMGILPLVLPPNMGPKQLAIGRTCQIELQLLGNEVGIRQPVLVRIHPADQAPFEIETISAVETQLESALLKVGGVMPRILAQSIHSGHQN
jgi:aconitate hydratase